MAKFYGAIGYGTQVEKAPSVWDDQIIERMYYGDVIRNTRQTKEGLSVNNDLTINNSISIVADAYLHENFYAIRYIRWAGACWTVSTIEVQAPRLILQVGAVYHGPTAGS